MGAKGPPEARCVTGSKHAPTDIASGSGNIFFAADTRNGDSDEKKRDIELRRNWEMQGK